MYGDVPDYPDAFGAINRIFICCTNDQILVPSTCKAIVDDLNAAWPDNQTALVEIASSHEVMFSKPKELATLIAQEASS